MEIMTPSSDDPSNPCRTLIRGLVLFEGAEPAVIEPFLAGCPRRDISAGEVLLSPECKNDYVYVVLSGRLDVHLESVDDRPLTSLESGACAGEMSVIEDKYPSAYVVAAEDTHLLVIDYQTIWQMINACHAIARNLLVILSERLRFNNRVLVENLGFLKDFEHYAITDALTGLPNRHWLEYMFRRELERCQLGEVALCLLMIDVDRFKSLNDLHGHLTGDNALRAVADVLRDHLRPTDQIARFGGDEFAALLPEVPLADALRTAERVRLAIGGSGSGDARICDHPPITVSIGVAQTTERDSLESLIHRADAALYRAKLRGRNQVSD
jgi:diguanylate cyclase (GGDEF)-like protein